jgi:hypothetical protein
LVSPAPQAAAEVPERYRGGGWLVELAPLAAPAPAPTSTEEPAAESPTLEAPTSSPAAERAQKTPRAAPVPAPKPEPVYFFWRDSSGRMRRQELPSGPGNGFVF